MVQYTYFNNKKTKEKFLNLFSYGKLSNTRNIFLNFNTNYSQLDF